MRDRDFVLVNFKSNAFDGRDSSRLVDFFPKSDWPRFGCEPVAGVTDETHPVRPWTRDAIMEQLESDLEFAFEKALNKRGISASCMYAVVKTWCWILNDGLHEWDDETGYAQYGLPLLAAAARKYGFPCPIGDDAGNESKYESD